MKDAYGRRIDYLRLSVTDLCNYRCIYCMPDSGVPKRDHSEILSVEELVDAAAQAVRCGVRKVRVTGGEPLVRRGILDICRGVASLDVEELCLTTNGSLLSGYAQALRRLLERRRQRGARMYQRTLRTDTEGLSVKAHSKKRRLTRRAKNETMQKLSATIYAL